MSGLLGEDLKHVRWLDPDDVSGAMTSGRIIAPLAAEVLFVFLASTLSHGVAGRSIGKLAVGLELVTTREGTRPPISQAVLRSVLTLVSLIMFGSGYFFMMISRRAQTLHDALSGTVTVLAASHRHRPRASEDAARRK